MAGPPTSAFSQVTLRWTGSALPYGAVTTHGFTVPTAGAGELTDALSDFASRMRECVAQAVTLEDLILKRGPVATGPSVLLSVGLTGTQVAEPLPPQVASLVRLTVADVSSRFAGRFYLPPSTENATDGGGLINGGTYEAMQTSITEAYAALAEVGMAPRIFSADSSDPRIVESVLLQRRFGSQRRRNRR